MKVGGQRTVRIPPNLAFGDQWYKGVIPPKSHLEFDIDLEDVAATTVDEYKMKLEQFGVGRAAGMAFCVVFLALSPMLS